MSNCLEQVKSHVLFLVAALVVCFASSAHAQQSVLYFSKSGLKQVPESEAHFYEIKEENETGGGTKTRFLAEDSSKVRQFTYSDLDGGRYKSGTLNGPYYEWYQNGNLKIEANYTDNELSGMYKKWYESGQLQYQRKYNSNDQVPDTLEAYYESGSIRRIEVYKKGSLASGKLYDTSGEEVEFFPMEQMPEFSGGEQLMLRWLASNIKYPKSTRKAKVQGLVVLSFVVDEQGRITGAEVIKGIHPDADAEALRVVNSMPTWNPGLLEGKPVAVRFTLPLRFSLN